MSSPADEVPAFNFEGVSIAEGSKIVNLVEEYQLRHVVWLTVQYGFPPSIGKTPTAVRPYWKIRQDLSHHDGLVLKGSRIVIPKSQRPHILARLHASHQGTRRTLARARQLVYWPGMSNDVTTTVIGKPGSFPEQSR